MINLIGCLLKLTYLSDNVRYLQRKYINTLSMEQYIVKQSVVIL